MIILDVEKTLLEKTRETLGNLVRQVDSLPGEFDTQTLKSLVRQSPGVYWSFLGGRAVPDQLARIEGRWAMYAVTGHASGQAARRTGDRSEVGAYELVSLLLPVFHHYSVPDAGSLKLQQVENLFNGTYERQGVAIYAASFVLPMTFEPELPENIHDFITFHSESSFGGTADDPVMIAEETLPQE